MDGDDDVVCGEPERPGDRRLEDFRDRLHLEIVFARAERAHLPTLPFLDAVGDVLRMASAMTQRMLHSEISSSYRDGRCGAASGSPGG